MATANYNRAAELKAFDDTKDGVRGLVAAGVTTVPRFFHVAPEDRPSPDDSATISSKNDFDGGAEIPVIDLGGRREEVVEAVRRASEEWGFFQVVGHGVPAGVLAAVVEAVRAFHEGEDGEGVKAALYSRDAAQAVKYSSNHDLFQSRVANWRDTLFCRMAPDPPSPDELPESCREELIEYSNEVKKLGKTLFGYLSEALGLYTDSTYLEDIECDQGQIVLSHYYPPCPQPDLAIGTSKHCDPAFLTILLQDHIGGLQVLKEGQWLHVPPSTTGAFVVNIGDLLQLISNDKFKSVEHRVVAKDVGPRISVACFFTTHFDPCSTRLYGPIKEILSQENPPLYRETTVRDYVASYYSRGLGETSALLSFRL